MNRWLLARSRAHQLRQQSEAKAGRELYGLALLNAVVADADQLDCFEVVGTSPLLGNAQAGYDLARYYADRGWIVVSRDLPDEATRNLYKAHELGHRVLHTRSTACQHDDVDMGQLVLTLPYAEGRVATYNSRQLHENEATVFATELLVPSDRLAARFDSGLGATELALEFQVPRHVVMAQMAASLLGSPADFEAALAASQEPPFSWQQLDDSQRKACCALPGPVLVQAGPGTGKTRTLTSRIEWLVSVHSVAAERILGLTFSNRATDELRLRLHHTLPLVAHQVTVSTLHGFGLELLRRYSREAGYESEVAVIDPIEAELLLEEHLGELGLEHFADPARPNRYLADLLQQISRAKEELLEPSALLEQADRMMAAASDDEARTQAAQVGEVGRVYSAYQGLLRDRSLVDYGDLIQAPVHLLRSRPELLEQLRSLYDHVLVDEYQDINRANGELVQLLAGQDGLGLWAVGDLRQSIYRFRGATPEYLRQFDQYYPNVACHELEVNYRAPQPLVSFVTEVASKMSQRLDRPVWKSGVEGHEGQIIVAVADDRESELFGVASNIRAMLEGGVRSRDIAILCRTNSQAAEMAAALRQLQVPALHLGKFFFRPEIKDLLAVLTLTIDGYAPAWLRVAALMPDPIPPETAEEWWHQARRESSRFPQALLTPPASLQTSSSSQLADLRRLADILITYARYQEAKPWSVLADFLFEFGDYLRALRRQAEPNTAQALLALRQLLSLARAFGQRASASATTTPIEAFIRHIRRLIERDDGDIDLPINEIEVNAVHVLTVHKSKGLEFPIVFVPNLADQRFPPRGDPPGVVPDVVRLILSDAADEEDLEEESCLFVAISRCQQTLILSRAESYGRRQGKPVSRKPSPLWRLLDPALGALAITNRERWQVALSQLERSDGWQVEPPGNLKEPGAHHLLRDLRVYQRCPRQYFYRNVLHLAVPDDHDIYVRFLNVIRSVADWIQQQLAEGAAITWPDALAKLAQVSAEGIPADHAFAAWYLHEARSRVQMLWRELDGHRREGRRVRHHMPGTVEVGGLLIDFHVDEVVELTDRHIVTQWSTGRAPKTSREDPRPALYRLAASAEGPVDVQVHYLGSDTIVPIPEKTQRKALESLTTDIANLRAGNFPPEPSTTTRLRPTTRLSAFCA